MSIREEDRPDFTTLAGRLQQLEPEMSPVQMDLPSEEKGGQYDYIQEPVFKTLEVENVQVETQQVKEVNPEMKA